LKLSQKINRYIAPAFIVTLCVCVLILIPLQKKKARVLNQKITSLMQTFLTNDMGPLANAIFEKRTRAINIRVKKILQIKGVENAFVFDEDHMMLTGTDRAIAINRLAPHFKIARHHHQDAWTENGNLWYLKSIRSFEELIGFILVEYTLTDMKKAENLSIFLYAGIISGLMLILLLVSRHLIRKIILRPVAELVENMTEIQEGNYGSQIHTVSSDEIGDLSRRFNAMSREIAGSYRKIEEKNHELHQTKNLLGNIINSMPSLLITVDQNLRILEWNTSASASAGLTLSQARGKPLNDVLPLVESTKTILTSAIGKQEVKKLPKVSAMVGSQQFWLDIVVYPIDTDSDKRGVIIIDDITDTVRMEAMMIQTEKMMSVGGLAAGMAHEINNPLAGMIQNAQVIQNRIIQKLPANQKAAEELGISLDTIGAYMEKRQIPHLLAAVRKSGERASHIVRNMLSPMPGVECEGNNIQQVFFNILKNGAEAMGQALTCSHAGSEAPGKSPEFILRIRDHKEMAWIEIQDNGPGMDKETQKRVFEPFFTTKKVGMGTGLGLSVSYFIVAENHNGEMSAESAPGFGTTFVIKLPYHHQRDTNYS